MRSPKRNVAAPFKKSASESKFDSPAGLVSVTSLAQYFHLVRKGCPKCSSSFVEVDVAQFGACLKAKMVCKMKHQTSWNSSDGTDPSRCTLISFLIIQACQMGKNCD